MSANGLAAYVFASKECDTKGQLQALALNMCYEPDAITTTLSLAVLCDQ